MNHSSSLFALALVVAPALLAGTVDPPRIPVQTLKITDGKKNGLEVRLFDKGGLREVTNWKDGKKHGPFRSYHEKGGHIDKEGEYIDGLREGQWKWYNSNGEIVWDKPFVHDKVHGVEKQYYNDWDDRNNPQPLAAQTAYEEGVEHGECVKYWPDGKVSSRGQYEHGEREGVWNHYYSTGKPMKVSVYHKGQLVSETNAQ